MNPPTKPRQGPGAVPLELLDASEARQQRALDGHPAMKAAREHAQRLAAMAAAIGLPIDVFAGACSHSTVVVCSCVLPWIIGT